MSTLLSKAAGFGYDLKKNLYKVKCGNKECSEWFLKSFAEGQTHAKCEHCHTLNDCLQYIGGSED